MTMYEITLALTEDSTNTWVEVVERRAVAPYLVGATKDGLAIVSKVEEVKE